MRQGKHMVKHALFCLLMIALAFLLTTCDIPLEGMGQQWLVTSNIDGGDLQDVCRKSYESCYFVPAPNDTERECIMIDCGNKIELINLDGTDRRTIVDLIGGVCNFNRDRTRMLLADDNEIYIAKTDGTDLQNLTNTPSDLYENYAAFSPDEESVVFKRSTDFNREAFLVVHDLQTGEETVILQESAERYDQSIWFTHPTYIDSNTIVYIRFFHSDEPSLNSSLHKLSLDTLEDETLIDDDVHDFYYESVYNRGLVFGEEAYFVNMETLAWICTFGDFSPGHYDRVSPFGSSGLRVVLGRTVFDLENGHIHYLDTYMNDFNRDETRILGTDDR